MIKERRNKSLYEMHSYKEDIVKQNITVRTRPFHIEAHIDIFTYDNSINDEILHSWID